jgi:ABC-type uncharacterized transport system substrate-binding protein
MQATTAIPIVMVGAGDPVGARLVASLARPGSNVTGNTVVSADIIAKRLQLARQAIPTVTRVALLWNPDNASHAAILAEARAAAPGLAMVLIPVGVRSVTEFDTALAAMMTERPDAFIMTNEPKNPETGSTSERERAMAMFEGPDRNRNIMITVAVVVIAVIIFLYTTNRLPGL